MNIPVSSTPFRVWPGARDEPDGTISFGDPSGEQRAARDSTVVCDVGASGVLSVAGPDAAAFLQGQLTNDVDSLAVGSWQLAAWCSAKGRVLVVCVVRRLTDESFELLLPGAQVAPIRKRLSMFVLRAKVVIEDRSAATLRFGVGGPSAALALRDALDAVPEGNGIVDVDGALWQALPGKRFLASAGAPTAMAQWERVGATARRAAEPTWTWLRVRSGVARVTAATSDQFVPQSLNLDALDAINFRKGCYAGQEIVARTQYLGRLKERLVLAHVDAAAAAGERLYSAVFDAQACGTVIEAAPAPDGGSDLLAVVQLAARDEGVRLHNIEGPRLEVLPLPYPIPAAPPPRGRM
ncbi:MAG TPA: folate-binding protein [Casimicrobiaceae bacterium]